MSRPSRARLAAVQTALDAMGPPAGSCAFCGLPDKRHRLLDSLAENVRAGDSPEFVADVYGTSLDTVEAAVAVGRVTRREYELAASAQREEGSTDD